MSERKILEDCRKIPYNNKISGLWKEGTEMQRSNPREVAAEALMEIRTEGYIISLCETTELPEGRLKDIREILDSGKPVRFLTGQACRAPAEVP